MNAPPAFHFADLVARLDVNLREYFEERAGVREFDGGLSRDHAECAALLDTLRRDPLAFTGVMVLRVERGGVTQIVLTNDPSRLLSVGGATVLGAESLHAVLAQFKGLAVLWPFG